MKNRFFIIFTFLFSLPVFSSGVYKYWVEFTDKDSSFYSLSNPYEYLSSKAIARRTKQNIAIDSSDLPVNEIYIDSVIAKGATIVSQSKWLNGITIAVSDTSIINSIADLPFVKSIDLTYIPNYQKKAKTETNNFPSKRVASTNEGYGNAYTQISIHNGDWLHQAGFRGDSMTIAVIDAGFLNVNSIGAFSQAFTNGQILGTKDFVDPTANVYSGHYHGGQVFSVLAANQYNTFIGTAPNASYFLLRTEDPTSEFPVEPDNLVAAIEYADSAGVDIVSASLGYFSFDNPTMSYTYANMNGKTCRASIAETMAARKGMIVVNSAGNEGSNTWHYITAPADADSILAVGSVTTALEKSGFSSWGPTIDGRIKPTVCAMGSGTAVINSAGEPATNNGTSLACPIISGLTACLWQALPNLTNMQIIELIKKHSSNHDNPDNSKGYGIPDFYAAYAEGVGLTKSQLLTKDDVNIYPNPSKDGITVDIKTYAYSKKLNLILISMDGKKVFSERIHNAISQFSLSSVKPGVYTVFIKSEDKILYRDKLIKK
jgi:hypothetical protein